MSVSCELFASKKFQKQFSKLPRDIQKVIDKEIQKLRNDSSTGEPLKGDLEELRSIHIDDYRLVYSVKENTVYLAVVGHRSHVYDDLKHYLKTS
jgi:addiction module RelE/StbE family toxin